MGSDASRVFLLAHVRWKAVVEVSDISVLGARIESPCWVLAFAPGWAAPEEQNPSGPKGRTSDWTTQTETGLREIA